MSVVFGVLLATTLQLIYELICVETLFFKSKFAWALFDLDLPWLFFGGYVGFKDDWWEHIAPFRVAAMVMMVISIAMLILLVSGKNWRTKMLHAINTAFLAWLIAITVFLAYHAHVSIGLLALLMMLTAIPLLALIRTAMPEKSKQ